MPRVLTEAQQKEFFNLLGDPKTLDAKRMAKIFGMTRKKTKDGKPGSWQINFKVDDKITIGPAESKFVSPGSVTTCGIYIANKYIWEDLEIFGYINKTIDGGTNKQIDAALEKALKEGDITYDQYARYIDRCQYLYGGPLAHMINASISETLLTLPKGAKKKRKELLEQNSEALAANDPQTAAHVEKEVVKVALDEMRTKNDPAMALFDSGCGVDPYNNYKTICVMKGAIEDNTGESPTGYKVITSNYDTGVSKEDMPKIADTVVTSSYSSGVATQDSGANGKKYNALFQRVRLQNRNSDCGSKQYLNVKLSPDVADDYIYRWINDGGKLVMLTTENISKYVGKTVQMRSGIHCHAKDPEYCSRCVGDRPYRVGIRNIGLAYMTISGSTLNASLKKKHDVSIKFYTLTVDDIMKYVS